MVRPVSARRAVGESSPGRARPDRETSPNRPAFAAVPTEPDPTDRSRIRFIVPRRESRP